MSALTHVHFRHYEKLQKPGEWIKQAACAGMDPDMFHPERGDNHTRWKAVQICEQCPVRQACADYAIDANEQLGIWGGLGHHGRRHARHAREQVNSGLGS